MIIEISKIFDTENSYITTARQALGMEIEKESENFIVRGKRRIVKLNVKNFVGK